jgi:4'-phosphopantetheinyl transferase
MRLGISPREIVFSAGAEGKPHVEGYDGCEFSISHSGDWLVIGTCRTAIGVDIETRRPRADPLTLARRFFSESDVVALADGDASEAFQWQWVAKEAAVKAAGCGLANHLHRATCIRDTGAIVGVRWDDEYFSISTFRLEDGSPGALAWAGKARAELRWRDVTELVIS